MTFDYNICYFCMIRLEDIAGDAELQEKSETDLKNLAEMVLTRCDQVMKEYEEKMKDPANAGEGEFKRNFKF